MLLGQLTFELICSKEDNQKREGKKIFSNDLCDRWGQRGETRRRNGENLVKVMRGWLAGKDDKEKKSWGSAEGRTLPLNFSRSASVLLCWAACGRFPNTYYSSGQACRERGAISSLGSRSVDASRHRISFTIASSRQGPWINHVQCDTWSLCGLRQKQMSCTALILCRCRRVIMQQVWTTAALKTLWFLKKHWLIFPHCEILSLRILQPEKAKK